MHEKIIVAMETLGMFSVAIGLGFVAAWWFGYAGGFLAFGLSLLGFATLIALRQTAMMRQAGGKQP